MRRFTIYKSDNTNVVTVTNGGVDFNSSDTSGNLVAVSLGSTKVRAVFFDLEKEVDVNVYDLASTGFGQLFGSFESHIDIANHPDDVQPDRFRAFFSESVASHPQNAVEVSDEVRWVSGLPDILQFDSTPGREGYYTLTAETGPVYAYAYYPRFRVWTVAPVFHIVDEDDLNGPDAQ